MSCKKQIPLFYVFIICLFLKFPPLYGDELQISAVKDEIVKYEPIFLNIKGRISKDNLANAKKVLYNFRPPKILVHINKRKFNLSEFNHVKTSFGVHPIKLQKDLVYFSEGNDHLVIDNLYYVLFLYPNQNKIISSEPGEHKIFLEVPDSDLESNKVKFEVKPVNRKHKKPSKLFKDSKFVFGLNDSRLSKIEKGHLKKLRIISKKYPNSEYAKYANFFLSAIKYSRISKNLPADDLEKDKNLVLSMPFQLSKEVESNLPKPSRWHLIMVKQLNKQNRVRYITGKTTMKTIKEFLKEQGIYYPKMYTSEHQKRFITKLKRLKKKFD